MTLLLFAWLCGSVVSYLLVVGFCNSVPVSGERRVSDQTFVLLVTLAGPMGVLSSVLAWYIHRWRPVFAVRLRSR